MRTLGSPVKYTAHAGTRSDAFIEFVANIRTGDEEDRANHEGYNGDEILDMVIRQARRLTNASGPLGMLLEDENVDPAFRRALADNEKGVG